MYWIIATHLTEQPPTASLSLSSPFCHLRLRIPFPFPLPPPRDSHLCVVNALGSQEHQITANNIYVFIDFI